MDKLFSAGKEFLEQQQHQHQQQQQQQGGGQGQGQYLPPGNNAFGGNYPAGGNFQHDDPDLQTAHQQASYHAGSSGNSDLFSNILGSIGQNKGRLQNEDIDEHGAVQAHKDTYNNQSSNLSEGSMGTAAAMQALKLFNGGGGSSGGSGGSSQGAFLGLAMSEASKLFDSKAQNGQVAPGASKESVVQQAGEMAMKMYFKSQGNQAGGLMGLATKLIG